MNASLGALKNLGRPLKSAFGYFWAMEEDMGRFWKRLLNAIQRPFEGVLKICLKSFEGRVDDSTTQQM